jgi:hypothetical protein
VLGGYLNLLIIAGSGVLNLSESENYLFPFCGGKSRIKELPIRLFQIPERTSG